MIDSFSRNPYISVVQLFLQCATSQYRCVVELLKFSVSVPHHIQEVHQSLRNLNLVSMDKIVGY